MDKQKFDVNVLRVASPCSVGWQTMTGGERVRHCHSCQLNIYNTAEMTKKEVEGLILNREGRLCIRLLRRADGTVITKDCPVGLSAFRKRTAIFAGATLAAILGLFSTSFGQKEDKKSAAAFKTEITRTTSSINLGTIVGTIRDPQGAVVPGAHIRLYREGAKNPIKTTSDANGNYSFSSLQSGIYQLKVKSPGFTTHLVTQIEVMNNEKLVIDISLQPDSITVTVGIFAEEPVIDMTSSTVTTTITKQKLETIPN